jgi:hypothetical protein
MPQRLWTRGPDTSLVSAMTARIDEFCADGSLWYGVPWRRTLCVHAWTSSKTSCGRELSIRAIPRPGPNPSSVSLAPKVPLSQWRARRRRSGKRTMCSSAQAVGFSGKESVGPFPFDSQA